MNGSGWSSVTTKVFASRASIPNAVAGCLPVFTSRAFLIG